MAKVNPIILTDNETGEKYTLEFSRESAVFTNRSGFKPSEFFDNVEEMLPILFYGAFRMHHKNVSKQKTDKILFEDLGGIKHSVASRLIDLYSETRNSLLLDDDEVDEVKNPKMTLEM